MALLSSGVKRQMYASVGVARAPQDRKHFLQQLL
jgi:hypothetical protein